MGVYVERECFKYMVYNGEEGKAITRASPLKVNLPQITRIIFLVRFLR